ncbi:hypothetical protein LSH36_269g02071 [Paralvinella palmiformis]|uniref:Uncharacterized protein n=1 Tax=Paralvinella palmiformis TaxID=53620 RepID=A0AAD9JKL7_9ANNE|nr:hypothetical protein LSH36_269g02071 [Paralvinella palmiformis]
MEQNCDSLTDAYNKAVDALKSLRTFHIQLTTRYIVIPASRIQNEYKSLSKKGTGNTEMIPFLKSIRDSTATFKVQAHLANNN